MNWVLALIAALAIGPFIREAFRRPISATRRDAAPGQMATLSQGKTYLRWRGPEDGPVAVCVHGLTTPSLVWDRLVDGMVEMGFRVLVYDLYGRGLSDRPRGAQDSDFFVRQLEDVLEAENIAPGFTLLGYSMGGAIAPAYAARHPETLRQLVLIAPGGLGHDLGPATRLMTNLGLFGAWLMQTVYARSFRRDCEAEVRTHGSVPALAAAQIAQLKDRGFIPAVLSSLRGILDEPLGDVHRAIADTPLPVLAIWGESDEIIPLVGRDLLTAYNPDTVQVTIEGAGHTLPYTDDPAVIAALHAHLIR